MPLVRIDLQLTEAEAHDVAALLALKLAGFKEAFDSMISTVAEPGKHMAVLCRTRDVQNHMDAGGT